MRWKNLSREKVMELVVRSLLTKDGSELGLARSPLSTPKMTLFMTLFGKVWFGMQPQGYPTQYDFHD